MTDAAVPDDAANGARPVAEDANVFWIFQDELGAINARRRALGRTELEIADNFENAGEVIEAVGLSLSGGGVRSAAVCLGVLQALNYHDVLRNIDYLSTVSGGGYTGCSLSATMSRSGGDFVYGNVGAAVDGAPLAAEISDTDAVGHLRNYSNYLIPAGMRDLVTGAAIVVRGLVANFGIVFPIVLLLAAVTIVLMPARTRLVPNLFGLPLQKYLPVENFGISLILFLVGLLLFLAWAVHRSFLAPDRLSEFRTKLPSIAAAFLVVLAITVFCELQPFVIAGMFEIADKQTGLDSGVLIALVTSWVKTLAAVLAPVSAAVMFFRQQLSDTLKSMSASSGLMTQLVAFAIKAAVWVAGFALPLVIWVVYLYLCYWGIANDQTRRGVAEACPPGSISATVTVDSQTLNYHGELAGKLQPAGQQSCASAADGDKTEKITKWSHAPSWLRNTSAAVSEWLTRRRVDPDDDPHMFVLYFGFGFILFLVSWLLAPNANSLHRLYRDRLSKAFLFDPTNKPGSKPRAGETSMDQGRDFAPLDDMRLSDLSAAHAPYHLINAALNIQGSDYANRRGRNADFFLFSKCWVGSVATGYAAVEDFEPAVPDLDLATAMAISGAAASSNMGSDTVRPLTPTLAILNVRLGYWLRNPAFWAPAGAVTYEDQRTKRNAWSPQHRSTMFLWREISGRLYENADEVYLTDGGHIENLGIYELLRRRCRIIIAVDAEADSAMHFPSLVTLQRYARIDLGFRIDLPWQAIQTTTLSWMNPKDGAAPQVSRGPHVALGTIDYGGGETGCLVYIKSSLTGDENDYVRDYARRNNRFPHESTGDQFFTEEQFEVYRALGFHMVQGFLSGQDTIAVAGAAAGSALTFNDITNPIINAVRDALLSTPHPD